MVFIEAQAAANRRVGTGPAPSNQSGMTTDTFETPQIVRSDITDETPPTVGRPRADSGHHPSRSVSERLTALRTTAGGRVASALDSTRGAWRRTRQRLGDTTGRIPAPAVRPLDTSILVVWSLAVALVAVEVALDVSPLLGIALALLEGVALGCSGRRLYGLVTRS